MKNKRRGKFIKLTEFKKNRAKLVIFFLEAQLANFMTIELSLLKI